MSVSLEESQMTFLELLFSEPCRVCVKFGDFCTRDVFMIFWFFWNGEGVRIVQRVVRDIVEEL